MNVKPIKSEEDYQATLRMIEELWDAEPNTPESDLLEILSTLVEAYENEHSPILPPNPIEAIRYRMEQLGLKKVDLAPFLGGRNRVTEILQGKRNLTVSMIRKLYEGLDIPPESLLG